MDSVMLCITSLGLRSDSVMLSALGSKEKDLVKYVSGKYNICLECWNT